MMVRHFDHMETRTTTTSRSTTAKPASASIRNPHPRSAHSVLTTTQESNLLSCPHCQKRHLLANCEEYKEKTVDDRADIIRKLGCCLRCLKQGHRSRECSSNKKCSVKGCDRPHHPTLHGAPRIFPKDGNPNSARLTEPDATVGTACLPTTEPAVFLSVVPVILRNGSRSVDTYALLDNGSEVSLILNSTAKSLHLNGPARQLRLGTFHGSDPRIDVSNVNFTVSARDGSSPLKIEGALTVPRLNLSTKRCEWSSIQKCFPHLADLPLTPTDYSKVTVLIGRNCNRAHDVLDCRTSSEANPGPDAILTPFGWCVVGPVHRSLLSPCRIEDGRVFHVHLNPDDLLFESVSKMWKTESFGVSPLTKPPVSPSDQRALEVLNSTIRHDGKRYEVGLLWKHDSIELPNNREPVLRQFLSLERRFAKDPTYASKYHQVMQGYIDSGHAALVNPKTKETSERVWYLPHHGVVSAAKPDKIRVVFNCSAKHQGTSLNDALLQGPDLLTSLLGVLLRFRQFPVPVTADIEKMFHQVRVKKEDQSALRFFYRKPGSAEEISTFQMTVHVFGAVSSPTSCLFALRRTAEDFKHHHPDVAPLLTTHMYMDNLLYSTQNEEIAIRHSKELKELCKRGGFNLIQWMSTSRRLLNEIGSEQLSTPILDLDLDKLPTDRTLGIFFDWQNDEFLFRLRPKPVTTMRELLREISTIHDPLGLIAAITLTVRTLFQETWRAGVGWDDPLPSKLVRIWQRWSEEILALNSLRIPRCIRLDSTPIDVELHCLSDASEVGFGAAVYSRTVYGSGSIITRLIMGKSRVAPLRQLSIPRLELQGAVMASRIARTVKQELSMEHVPTTFWTDSQTVLQWLHSKKCRFHAFVAHRVAEILENTEGSTWRHIPGELNPADDASRGIPATDLTIEHRWFRGPSFLAHPPEYWPPDQQVDEPAKTDPEIVASDWIGTITCPPNHPILVLAERVYRLKQPTSRLFRIVAWLLRFVRRSQPKQISTTETTWLRVDELQDAEIYTYRLDQWAHFSEELATLREGKELSSSSPISQLTPYIDEKGVLRVGGRLQRGHIGIDLKHPIILHHDSTIARLVIRRRHCDLMHASRERTLHDLREKFYVLRFRHVVRSVISKCLECRRLFAKPIIPLMGALPPDRLRPFQPPFTVTGIDYFGPLEVIMLRRRLKRWGIIFTCMTIRAVHLEIAHSLDTNSFLMAFDRFANRRGNPRVVYSDNGTNFVAGEKELKSNIDNLNNASIHDSLSKRNIEWNFSPPHAPHFGGAWERLIQSAKSALSTILKNRTVTDEILLTAMVGVEGLLNSRPLTHVAIDPHELSPLTPNHFLIGRSNNDNMQRPSSIPENISRKSWRDAQTIIDHFWRRWMREFMPHLIERRKWLKSRRNLNNGDVVLIIDPAIERGKWQIGRIIRAIKSIDGVVRQAEVQTTTSRLVRPIAKLCLIQNMSDDNNGPDQNPENSFSQPSTSS